jgi:hypothetical protein
VRFGRFLCVLVLLLALVRQLLIENPLRWICNLSSEGLQLRFGHLNSWTAKHNPDVSWLVVESSDTHSG